MTLTSNIAFQNALKKYASGSENGKSMNYVGFVLVMSRLSQGLVPWTDPPPCFAFSSLEIVLHSTPLSLNCVVLNVLTFAYVCQ